MATSPDEPLNEIAGRETCGESMASGRPLGCLEGRFCKSMQNEDTTPSLRSSYTLSCCASAYSCNWQNVAPVPTRVAARTVPGTRWRPACTVAGLALGSRVKVPCVAVQARAIGDWERDASRAVIRSTCSPHSAPRARHLLQPLPTSHTVISSVCEASIRLFGAAAKLSIFGTASPPALELSS
jgi:hypothetical protein